MITQEALFAVDVPRPPIPPLSVAQAELGTCCKKGCPESATLKSPGGSVYCKRHGYCGRRTCLKSVEKFVWHERLKIWCCSCILKFEQKWRRKVLDLKRCVRCNCELSMIDDVHYWAEDYEEDLLAEGIMPQPEDVLCDDCAYEVVGI